jgi:hypothetical protein
MTPREIELTEEIARLQERIHNLETALGQHDARIELAFRLPPSLAKLLGLLVALPVVTPEIILERVQLGRDYKNSIFRIRRQMHEFGVVISSQPKTGYWLTPEMKTRVQKLVADSLTA